jgi:uncharacterized protein YndB with AHSA1/START domain
MASKLWYRGPSLDTLHEDYAKHGRIDEVAPVRSTCEVEIDAPVATVWDLLSRPAAWPTWDSDIHDVTADAPTAVDAPFVWSSGRSRMRSRFAVVDPAREITWTGVSSGAKAVHRHLLDAPAPDRTIVRCEESMAGTLLGLFYDSDKMHGTLEAWLAALKTAAEASPAGS